MVGENKDPDLETLKQTGALFWISFPYRKENLLRVRKEKGKERSRLRTGTCRLGLGLRDRGNEERLGGRPRNGQERETRETDGRGGATRAPGAGSQ